MSKAPLDIRSLARAHTETAINTLVGVMTNEKARSSARVSAAEALLNRGWGRSIPTDEVGGGGIVINILRLAQEIAAPVDVTPRIAIQKFADHADAE